MIEVSDVAFIVDRQVNGAAGGMAGLSRVGVTRATVGLFAAAGASAAGNSLCAAVGRRDHGRADTDGRETCEAGGGPASPA